MWIIESVYKNKDNKEEEWNREMGDGRSVEDWYIFNGEIIKEILAK